MSPPPPTAKRSRSTRWACLPGLAIDSSTGTISGTVAAGDAQAAPSVSSLPFNTAQGFDGHYTVSVVVIDGLSSAVTTFDLGILSITSVDGENYDVNGDPTDGAELVDSPQGNHAHKRGREPGHRERQRRQYFPGRYQLRFTHPH